MVQPTVHPNVSARFRPGILFLPVWGLGATQCGADGEGVGSVKKAFRGLGVTDDQNQERHPDDFYGSADEGLATKALMVWMLPKLRPEATFWDPACGSGNIVRAVRETTQRPCAGTDLYDREWEGAATGIDFLKTKPGAGHGTTLISNPPFQLAKEFILVAHAVGPECIAFLLKATYFHASKRLELFQAYRPRYILPLTWRVDFTGQGSPVMECSWFVWLPAHKLGGEELCEYIPLRRLTDE